MSKFEALTDDWSDQKYRLLSAWRLQTKLGHEFNKLDSKKVKFNRKLRAIFPRGKIGNSMKQDLCGLPKDSIESQ